MKLVGEVTLNNMEGQYQQAIKKYIDISFLH